MTRDIHIPDAPRVYRREDPDRGSRQNASIAARGYARPPYGPLVPSPASARLSVSAVFICAAALLIGGCQAPGVVFPPVTPAIVWPADVPRIRYVGHLRTNADLKPGRSFFVGLGQLVFGPPTVHALRGPRSVVSVGSCVWVTDPGGRCIHGFDLESRRHYKIETVDEKADAGVGTLRFPSGLCRGPDATFFCCDSVTGMLFQFRGSDGTLVKTIQPKTPLARPTAIAYSAETSSLYVLDTQQHDVKQLTLDGGLRRIIGKRGSAPGAFNFPVDLVCDHDRLWVADACNGRVQGLTLDGKPVTVIGQFGKGPGNFALPKGVAVDSGGRVYVVDARFENVQIFDRQGRFLMNFGDEGKAPGEFSLPSGIFADGSDRIWVCDSYNHRLQLFQLINKETTRE